MMTLKWLIVLSACLCWLSGVARTTPSEQEPPLLDDTGELIGAWRAQFGGGSSNLAAAAAETTASVARLPLASAIPAASLRVQRSPHTHGRSWARVLVHASGLYVRLNPPLVDMWELTRYDDVLALLERARTDGRLPAPPFELALSASDHFALAELQRKAAVGGHGDSDASFTNTTADAAGSAVSCAQLGSCLMWVASRPRERAPEDRFQLLYPGFEFALQQWFADERAVEHYSEQFDRKRPHRWRQKRPGAVWRGSPNGLHFAPGEWHRLAGDGNPRARLVAFAQHSSLVDARFVAMPEQEREWAFAEPAFADSSAKVGLSFLFDFIISITIALSFFFFFFFFFFFVCLFFKIFLIGIVLSSNCCCYI